MQSTHVEVVVNLPRDEGSTPSASTYQAGRSSSRPAFFCGLPPTAPDGNPVIDLVLRTNHRAFPAMILPHGQFRAAAELLDPGLWGTDFYAADGKNPCVTRFICRSVKCH